MGKNNTVNNFFSLFQRSPLLVFSIIVLLTVILRLPSVLIDFIHVDVLTSYLLAKRELLGLSFSMNKGWLYHELMKFSIAHIADTPSSFHFIGLLFILGTMFGIYLLAKKIYNNQTALFSAFLYGVVLSCYHTGFLAANGEIFYNLFNVAALYCYYLAVFEKKRMYIIGIILSIIGSYLIKFQGLFIIPIIAGHFLLMYPFMFNRAQYIQFYKKAALTISLALCALLGISAVLYLFFQYNIYEKIYTEIVSLYSYVANRGFNPLIIITKLLWRMYQFSVFHAFFWYPGILLIIYFLRTIAKNNPDHKPDHKTLFLIFVSIGFFIMVFSGMARVSVHYFIPILPTMAMLSAKYILDICRDKGKKLVFMQMTFTILFFLSWHYRDLYIYYFNHDMKHNESRIVEIFRIAVIGSYGEYLLPHKSLLPAIDFINNNYPDRKKLVWPMGNEIDYFASGHSIVPSYWFNEGALFAIVQRERGNYDFIKRHEDHIIALLREHKPELFVDVGSTDMIKKVMVYRQKGEPLFHFNIKDTPIFRFGRFASLDDFPAIIHYLNTYYEFKGCIGEARIWVRK